MRKIECKVNVYLPHDAKDSSKEVADKLISALIHGDKNLFNTVIVDAVDEQVGKPQRKILSAVVDFDELRKAIVDNYNAVINEMRTYHKHCKAPKKSKSDLFGVYLMLDDLRENVEWLLRCQKPLPEDLSRVLDAYFFTEPKKEKEQSK